ncbi:MAG: transposase [Planctomycetota bacterium]
MDASLRSKAERLASDIASQARTAEDLNGLTRLMEAVWPIGYFDGIVVHVHGANGRVSQHTIYVALGVNLEGHKELLGLWLGQTVTLSLRHSWSSLRSAAASSTSRHAETISVILRRFRQ